MPYDAFGNPYDRETRRMERQRDALWSSFFAGLIVGVAIALAITL